MKGRPQLEKAIDALGIDDVLVIAEWDRATRSMMDGITIIQRVADRGATVKVLDKPWLDLTSPMGKGILAFLSALAEDERERITRRANEGRAAAVKRGVKFGPKPKLTDHQRAVALERLSAGKAAERLPRIWASHTRLFQECDNQIRGVIWNDKIADFRNCVSSFLRYVSRRLHYHGLE